MFNMVTLILLMSILCASLQMVAMWQETQEQGKEVVMSTEQLSNVPSGEETKYYLYKRVRELESLIIQAEVLIYLLIIERQRENILSSNYLWLYFI